MAKRKRLAELVKECVKEHTEILAEELDCLRVDVVRLTERLGEANQEREAALRERDAADAYAKECEARTATLRQALLRLLGGGRLERELLSRHECELAAHRAVLASEAPQ